MNDDKDNFTNNICRVLDQSLDTLDTVTENKVSQLKYRALDSTAQKKSWKLVWGTIPATAALLMIVLFNLPQNQQIQIASPDIIVLNILTAKESLDFYAEDIEFYEWLSEAMENEPELSGQHTAVPVGIDADNRFSTENRRNVIAQSGTDRVSWGFRG
ncbi:MAG: hypothetical protein J7K90_14350 [Desulfuromusa sp.]|nr:hypothetical protein [Desulfuromusa sp.]